MALFVHLLPSLIPPDALRGGTAVVLDVLRATTTMVQAIAAGCECIVPCLEVEDARSLASGISRGSVVLGGERGGLPIPGFDLGNSPGDYTPERCAGKTVVMTTTNGTKAILACLEAETVLVASFQNLLATCEYLARQDRAVHIVCAGTVGEISLEDTMLAGSIVFNHARLKGWERALTDSWDQLPRDFACNDAAILALAAAWELEGGFAGLSRILASGKGGRRVREIGLEADIQAAASSAQVQVVAILERDPIRIVRG